MAKRLGERLIEAGLVSAEAVDQALSHQQISGHRLGDCLVELGLVQETALLRFLAAELKTRFVSGEKLAKVKIPPEALEKVPVRLAEGCDFLPIAIDLDRKLLSVVMAQPQNGELIEEITRVTGMTEVFAFVGVRSAIQAAIKKHYYGDPSSFENLQPGPGFAGSRASGALAYEGSDSRNDARVSSSGGASSRTSSRLNPTQLRDALAARGMISEADFNETLNVLVDLLEMPRKAFRGHSGLVARQSSLIARRLGLQPRDVVYTSVAGYLHDLGKRPDLHFTVALLAAKPDLKAEAKRFVRAPVKLFEMVHLAGGINAVLAQLYETYDGTGVPQGVAGEEITAGARIIAAVDTFFDLTRNPANHLGRLLPKQEALDWLHAHAGTLFDPMVVDTLSTLQSGDLLRQRVENDGRQVVVADPDEAVRTDLMDALGGAGMVVQSVLKLDGVIDAVLTQEADTLVVGLSFGVGDLVALTQFVRARPESASVPLLVLGDPTDPAIRERLVQAGVTGFVPLPLSLDQAAAAIRGAYRDRIEHGGVGHLVRGGFDELDAPALLQILGAGRKSGKLTVRSGPHDGYLQLEQGRAVFASFGDKRGEAALAPIFSLPQADFQYDPEAILLDMPNADKDLEIFARALKAGRD
jgi:CheY-like chemotaxis protein